MEKFFKWILLTLIGFIVAIFLYPALHELGHFIASSILGGKQIKIELFPYANTFCNAKDISNIGIAIISLCGLLFPFLISFLIKVKSFFFFYIGFIFNIINLFALLIGIYEIFFPSSYSDESIILQNIFGIKYFLLILYVFLALFTIYNLKSSRFILHLNKYFS